MRSRLFWRRSAAVAGTYVSAALGFGATVVALHVFSRETFGRYALVLAATAIAVKRSAIETNRKKARTS